MNILGRKPWQSADSRKSLDLPITLRDRYGFNTMSDRVPEGCEDENRIWLRPFAIFVPFSSSINFKK